MAKQKVYKMIRYHIAVVTYSKIDCEVVKGIQGVDCVLPWIVGEVDGELVSELLGGKVFVRYAFDAVVEVRV